MEVGWEGDLEADFLEPADTAVPTEPRPTEESSFNEELIDDPYARSRRGVSGLKARSTPEAGQSRLRLAPVPGRAEPAPDAPTSATEEPVGSLEPSPATTPPGIRAEPQHEFAPYSQLFTGYVNQNSHDSRPGTDDRSLVADAP